MNNGIGFIVHDKGWAASDDVIFDVEQDPIPGPDGKKILQKTNTLKFSFIFEQGDKIVKGLKCFCLFKADGKIIAFTGEIRGRGKETTAVNLFAKTERIKEIIAKIKSGGIKNE